MKTTYILLQIITAKSLTVQVAEEKVLRFPAEMHICYLRLNDQGEIVVVMNEDPTDYKPSEARTDVFLEKKPK